MSYKVRLLTHSEKFIPFSTLKKVSDRIKLASGTDQLWERIEILGSGNTVVSTLDRDLVNFGSVGETTLTELRNLIEDKYPVNARQWLQNYFSTVNAIYTFYIFTDRMNNDAWPILGEVQIFLKDSLHGVTQVDNEGFYNEVGDLILWQMHKNTFGSIPAATLNDKGEWVSHSLKFGDGNAVDAFKQGIAPKKGFLSRFFRL